MMRGGAPFASFLSFEGNKHGLSQTPPSGVASCPGALRNPLVPAAGRHILQDAGQRRL